MSEVDRGRPAAVVAAACEIVGSATPSVKASSPICVATRPGNPPMPPKYPERPPVAAAGAAAFTAAWSAMA